MMTIRYTTTTETDQVDADTVTVSTDNAAWFILTKAGAEAARINTATVASITRS